MLLYCTLKRTHLNEYVEACLNKLNIYKIYIIIKIAKTTALMLSSLSLLEQSQRILAVHFGTHHCFQLGLQALEVVQNESMYLGEYTSRIASRKKTCIDLDWRQWWGDVICLNIIIKQVNDWAEVLMIRNLLETHLQPPVIFYKTQK